MSWKFPRGMWRSLFGSNSAAQGRGSAPSRARRRPLLEQLEDRNLLSTGVPNPIAYPQFAQTDGITPVTISVLNNDFAPGGSGSIIAGSVRVMRDPAHGQFSINSTSGQVTYTANPGYGGTDTFTYTFKDTQGTVSNAGEVVVQVNRPTAADDWTDTDGSTPVQINVLSVGSDPDGNQHLVPSSVTVVSAPQHGQAVVDPSTGIVTYTCTSSTFTGTDSFRYTVSDDQGATSNTATVYVRINRPVAGYGLATFTGTTPVTIDVVARSSDPDGNQHLVSSSVTVVSQPQHGTVSVDPTTGAITYTAKAGFDGTDIFSYTIMDDNGATSLPATVTVVGFQPNSMNGTYNDTDGSTPVTINVLAVDFVNSQPTPKGTVTLVPGTLKITGGPSDGTVAIDPTTGDVTYTCTVPGFLGTDRFQYTVQDKNGVTYGPTPVSVRVNRPTAADNWSDTDGTTPVTVAVLANDSDPDGDQHLVPSSVTIVSQPLHGTASVDPTSGQVTYTCTSTTFMGTDSFKYTVGDDQGATSNVATVYVRINRPTATNDYAAASGATPVLIDVLANDTDPDGNQHIVPSTVTVVTPPKHGQVSVNTTTGAITYTANAGWHGVDTFQYTVTDDNGGTSVPGTVYVVTSLPSATNLSAAVDGTTPVIFAVLGDASDPAGSGALLPGGVTVTKLPLHGQVTIDPKTGAITYIADKGFYGADSFQYTVTDQNGAVSKTANVSLNVAA